MDDMKKLMEEAEKSLSKPYPSEKPHQERPVNDAINTNLQPKSKLLITCKDCGKEISKGADICPHCGKKIKSKSGCGWMLVILFFGTILIGVIMSNMDTNTQKNQVQPNKQQPEEALTSEYAQNIKNQYPAWSNEICNVIGEFKIRIGMTKEQVIASWGKPQSINESVGTWGKHEQWVYNSQYLYFENGILTSFQTSR